MGEALAWVYDLQAHGRCLDALAVFGPGEDHLAAEELHARMSDSDQGWIYGHWSTGIFIKAMDPGGHGVRPGPEGFCRLELVDAVTQIAARGGRQ